MYACSHGHFKVSFDTDDFERLFFHFLRESPNLLSYLDFQNKCLVDFFEELFIIWPMQRKEHSLEILFPCSVTGLDKISMLECNNY